MGDAHSALIGGLYADFMATGDESFLALLGADFHDHVSDQRGPGIWLVVKRWLNESFADREVDVHSVATDDDLVLVWATVEGTHVGSAFPWLGSRPASGRRVSWRQVHIFRLEMGKITEHWAVRDDLRVLETIDAP
jgi:predicted ester cyclase